MTTKKNFGKRILSLALTILMVVGLIPLSAVNVYAADEPVLNAEGYYEISNADQLYWFAEFVNAGNVSANAMLTSDIVVNRGVVSGGYEGIRVWTPIGNNTNRYSGSFDGNNKTVSGLYMSENNTNYVGLFGCIGALGSVTGLGIENTYFSSISNYGGNIAGANYGVIYNCYSKGETYGGIYIAGIAGYNGDTGQIRNCYFAGRVSGGYTGQIHAGETSGLVENCYWVSSLSATAEQFKSGEVAYLLGDAFGQTIGEDDYPVLGGDKVYPIKNCKNKILSYSNTNTSNVHVNYVNGFCDECGEYEPATDKNNDGVYEIANAGQLYWFAKTINKDRITINGELTADIVVNENVLDADGNLNSGSFMEWDAIGNYFNGPTLVGFHGTFDGNGKTISGIYTDFAAGGLFRQNYGTIKNINIVDSYFGGASFCSDINYGSIINCSSSATIGNASNSQGGICQINEGLVEFCTFTGKITSTSSMWYVGGICGKNGSVIKNCCSSASINGTSYIGGISGTNNGTVENCFSTGKITIPSTNQGRVCYGIAPGTVVNSYYINTSMNSGGGIAVSQAQFESGEVAYKLGEAWGQKIGTEASPVLGSDKIYCATNCNAENIYSNKNENGQHNFVNDKCTFCGLLLSEINLLKLQVEKLNTMAEENNVLESKKEPLNDIYQELLLIETPGDSAPVGSRLDLLKTELASYSKQLQNSIADGTWVKADYTAIDASVAEIVSSGAITDKISEKLEEIKSEISVMKESSETSKADVSVLMKEVEVLKDCVSGNHIFENSECTVCGAVCKHNFANGFCTVCEKACEHEGSTNGFCADCGGFESAYYNEETGNYEIGNAGQLYWFTDKVNNDNANFGSANAVLTADIVVNEGVMDENSTGVRAWTPIGSDSNQYTGTFDGNGKTVSGLYFNKSGVNYVGLFGCVGTNGTVKNIGVINSYFNGYDYVGGVVGRKYIRATVTNCYNTGTVSGEQFVGGVVGQNIAGTTNDCYNTGTVSGSRYVGGVVGHSYESTIANCYNTGTVSGERDLGGVVGYNYESTINNCYNTSTVSGIDYIGGVVGYAESATIKNCYNTGTVSGSRFFGGVVGYNEGGTVTNCYYSETAAYGGINGRDITGSAEAKTTEQFESGEVAYLLGEAFGQEIGEDDTPVLGGDKVYFGYENCEDDAEKIYTNTEAYDEKPSHDWDNGVCTVCDKACEHQWEDGVCTICGLACTHQWNAHYGTCDICSFECTHEEFAAEFNWSAPIYGICEVEIKLICDDCGKSVASNWGAASIAESAEGTDCLHPGYELYEITFEIDGISYTDSYKHILKSDNHVGEFENGFCSECGGYEPATYNEEKEVYEISNAGQLYWYAQKLNEENAEIFVVLANDIVIPENAPMWKPINASYVFFDGQFNTISGLKCINNDYTYVGMVGNAWWCEITNLHITDSIFEGTQYVGGLAASMDNGGIIQNCYVTNTTVKGGDNTTGTLVGYLSMCDILNCYVDTETLVGYHDGYGSIENSYYLAEVETEDGGKTLEQFKSGEVACLLGDAFGQKLGTDNYPVLKGDKVYYVTNCKNETVYSNTNENGQHNFVDGICTVCGEAQQSDKLAGYTISLGDKISVNYFMSLTEKTINDANAKMVFTVPDTGSTYTLEIPVSEAVKSGDYYVFTCEVAAKEMTSAIEAKLVTSEGELTLKDYTVQQYAEVILSDTTKYAKEQNLVKAMLNYGACAQLYFGYNTDNLANDTEYMTESDKVLIDNLDLNSYNMSVNGSEEGVTFYGGALSLESETAIKLYFVIEDGVEIPEVTVNGKAAQLIVNGSLYELKIADIPAHKLHEMYEVKVGGLTVDYGVFSYGYTALNSGKEALVNIIKAMYVYNQKAVEYKG